MAKTQIKFSRMESNSGIPGDDGSQDILVAGECAGVIERTMMDTGVTYREHRVRSYTVVFWDREDSPEFSVFDHGSARAAHKAAKDYVRKAILDIDTDELDQDVRDGRDPSHHIDDLVAHYGERRRQEITRLVLSYLGSQAVEYAEDADSISAEIEEAERRVATLRVMRHIARSRRDAFEAAESKLIP